MREPFKYIKADPFFRDYCPQIRNHKHKIRGKNGKGKAVDFSKEETIQILQGIKKMFKNIQEK